MSRLTGTPWQVEGTEIRSTRGKPVTIAQINPDLRDAAKIVRIMSKSPILLEAAREAYSVLYMAKLPKAAEAMNILAKAVAEVSED